MDAKLCGLIRRGWAVILLLTAGCGASAGHRRHSAANEIPLTADAPHVVMRSESGRIPAETAKVTASASEVVPAEHQQSGTESDAHGTRTPIGAALSQLINRSGERSRHAQQTAFQVSDAPPSEEPAPAADDDSAPLPVGSSPPPPDGYTVTLWGVLSAAEVRNPNVALARQRINEAYARAERADFLWLPNLRVGGNFNHHEGPQQDAQGNILDVNRSSLYGGFGAGATGTGSPAQPGLVAQFQVTDAIFQPRITGHVAASRQFGAAATRNDILRNTAVAYLELVRAEFSVAIGEEALGNTRTLHDLAAEYARTGQGLRSDFERMQTELALRTADVVNRREAARVASARLSQLLHSNPSVPILSGEPMAVPLDILDADSTDSQLVATGLARRPELAEQQHLVCAAIERLNREKYAPFVPSVLLGLSYGAFGGGQGSTIADGNDRWDADAVAFWEIRNLGIGERAARRENSSLVAQEQFRGSVLIDQVAREVVEAHTQVVRRRERIAIAREAISAALKSHRLNLERIENAQGLPIEVLQSIQALAAARDAYLDAVIDYNVAEFELCRAVGWFVADEA